MVEYQIVALMVVGSNPTIRPYSYKLNLNIEFVLTTF